MRKRSVPAIAAAFVLSAAGAAGEELLRSCVWDRGGTFIAWTEASPVSSDYEYSINRGNGVLIASAQSKISGRKVESRGLCTKAENTPRIGF